MGLHVILYCLEVIYLQITNTVIENLNLISQQMLLPSSVLCLPLKQNVPILLMMKTVALLNILVPTIIKNVQDYLMNTVRKPVIGTKVVDHTD